MADRETIIDTGDGGAAAMVAGMLIVALVAIGMFYYFGIEHSTGASIDVGPPSAVVHVTSNGR